MDLVALLIIVGGLVLLIVLIFAISAALYRKVGPNEALLVYGFGGTKVIKGSGKVVWPMVQQSRSLSLELMSFDVAPSQDLYTNQGVAVNVEAVAQIKVKSDPVSILTAAEQFLNKGRPEQQDLIRLVMEGHLRGITGQLTVESIVKEPEMVADRMRSNIAEDMSKMGLEVISFTIREVRDKNEYILNMGKPDIALVRRQADIATAEADRDTAIRRANATREARIAEALAQQDEVVAQTASQTKQAEAVRDLNLKQAEYNSAVQTQTAAADKAYEIQANVQQQRVVEEEVRIEEVRKLRQVAVQEAEIQRREKELIATVLKSAEVERKRIETLAEADRQSQISHATGAAEATRLDGAAKADIVRLQGMAEAEIIRAKGDAEAGAMNVKALAYQEYNQAAVLDKLLNNLPEMVRAVSEPLSRIDRITVVGTGGDNSGMNKITGDMTQIVAQVPALLESLTGISINDLMTRVPGIDQTGSAASRSPVPRDVVETTGIARPASGADRDGTGERSAAEAVPANGRRPAEGPTRPETVPVE
ncbi:MAG: Inner membrane protein YqiK [uncultured Thermomicrobiales bacterium]|uniref:Inner membrane protein YqiK n=1 Tax=uncultured Thermomicrobiales bacterium TaxID=1645740 RepID=A0A6J4U7A6_9BACT|nr:MAG: Inner membrane protein YqiK [uncultured Thermomicrobiales bacterium]